jgi:small-conductance mechanosensitive channel
MVLAKHDDTHVIIPNESLITMAVVNHSLTSHTERVQLQFTIAFDSDLEQVIALAIEIASRQQRVLATPAPEAQVNSFGEHGVELILTVWVADPENGVGGLRSAIYLDIWKAFKQHEIRFVKPAAK